MSSPTAAVITLGCKVNQYESEAIAERLLENGFTVLSPDEICDVYIINTCTVTAEADRKSRQTIRRVTRTSPGASVIVCGCFSEGDPSAAEKLPNVSYVIGNKNKLSAADYALNIIKNGAPKSPVIIADKDMASVDKIEKMQITKAPRTRAYVKICDGCDGKCSYCIIPSVRGNVRSRPVDEIRTEVENLVSGGCREVVLTGIETASYGRDINVTLESLLRTLSEIVGLERIRMGSLEPTVMRPEFIKALSEIPHIVPHFHLSLQSGCSRTLASMRRKYNAEMAMSKLVAIREVLPDVMFTTDVIVGFPGETDEDFEETMEFVRRARFLSMHVFQYSKRKGTPAAVMADQVPENVKHERSSRLIALGAEITNSILTDFIKESPEADVLFESDINGCHAGHTANFIEVRTPLSDVRTGEIRRVRFTGIDGETVTGEIIS